MATILDAPLSKRLAVAAAWAADDGRVLLAADLLEAEKIVREHEAGGREVSHIDKARWDHENGRGINV